MNLIMRPKNTKQLNIFLGMMNLYCDVFPKQSHFLAPLSKLSTKKGNDRYCEATEHKDFKEVKRILSVHATLACLDFEKPFN